MIQSLLDCFILEGIHKNGYIVFGKGLYAIE